MVDRVGDAQQLAIEGVDRVGELPVAGAVRRTGGDRLERDGRTPDGSGSKASGRSGRPMRFSSGMRGTIP